MIAFCMRDRFDWILKNYSFNENCLRKHYAIILNKINGVFKDATYSRISSISIVPHGKEGSRKTIHSVVVRGSLSLSV